MAGTLDEIAHGIVTILKNAPVPEPLRVDLKGHTHAEAVYLAQAVADECAAAFVPLARVEFGLAHQFAEGEIADPATEWGTIEVLDDETLGSAVQFWRWISP